MSKGGSQQSSQTTQQQQQSTSTTSLPDWVTQAAQADLGIAQGVSSNLLTPYTGQRVAAMPEGAFLDIAGLGALTGPNPGYATAASTLAGLQGYTPSSVSAQSVTADKVKAGQLAGTDLSPYMDPYTQDVIDATLAQMRQGATQAINSVDAGAIGAGAFGGSRLGVMEGVTNAQQLMNQATMGATLRSQNFLNAQQQATNDINRTFAADTGNADRDLSAAHDNQLASLQAGISNQTAGIQGAGLRLGAATAGAQVAGASQQSQMQALMASLAGEGAIQQQEQSQLSAAQQLYQEQQQYPAQQLAILQQALAATPYGQTTSGSSSGTSSTQGVQPQSSSGLMQGIGGGLGILGTMGGLFGAGGAFPSAIPSLLSMFKSS